MRFPLGFRAQNDEKIARNAVFRGGPVGEQIWIGVTLESGYRRGTIGEG